MICKITISKIFFNSASKEGKAYISKKNGQPYKVVNMYGDFPNGIPSANGFAFQDSPVNQWKIGDRVAVEVSPREYQGKTYYDFRPASDGAVRLMELEKRVEELENFTGLSKAKMTPIKKELSDEEIATANEALEKIDF